MATLTIPLATFNPGVSHVGPAAVPQGPSTALVSIDRTAGAQPLNSKPASTTLDLAIELSLDSGATWRLICGGHAVGGMYIDDETNAVETSTSLQCPLPHPDLASRLARATITVGGSSLSLSGSLVLS